MDYYIQGDAAKADQIKAAFERNGIDTSANSNYGISNLFYYSYNGEVAVTQNRSIINIIKTHPGYKELELPVEQKFNVGDWIVATGKCVYLITKIDEFTVILVDVMGDKYEFGADLLNDATLWTVNDAKDGDVLVTTKIRNCPFIYRKTSRNNGLAYYYAGVDGNGDFCEGYIKRTLYHFGPVANVAPATKEQRDLLFAKMREAGYEWDEKKKELRRTIEPKFKVGDKIKTGSTIETIAEVDNCSQRYYCESGRTISFANQDLWKLDTKPHYDIKNFKPVDKVLVRDNDRDKWRASIFSYHIKGRQTCYPFCCIGNSFSQCIPFEGNEHLLGTTDMPSEEYINW